MVIVTQLYAFVKNHKTIHQKEWILLYNNFQKQVMAIFFKKERQLGRNNNNNNTDLKTMSPEQSQFIKRDTQLRWISNLRQKSSYPNYWIMSWRWKCWAAYEVCRWSWFVLRIWDNCNHIPHHKWGQRKSSEAKNQAGF